ncbi:MAG TPA: CHAT domain-containing protein [Micromonosporaceae bacterium]|nr:CHAT domain-containing protein [Micromonosporaceae bacterium]
MTDGAAPSARGLWMDLDGHRVAEVIFTRQDGSQGRGSGYRVRDWLVLTAAHVVSNAAEVTVRFDADQPGEWSAPAAVEWCDPAADVALLRLERVDGAAVSPVRFGRLARRAESVQAHLVGFPRWKLRPDPVGGWVREAHHAVGTIAGLSNPKSGTLEITVDPPAADPDPTVSPWEAMSGAAVWVAGCVVGVVSAHHRREGLGRLTAVRLGCLGGGEVARMLDLPDGAEALVDVLALAEGAVRAVPEDPRGRDGNAVDLVLEVDDTTVRLVGSGQPVVGPHGGISVALADAVNRLQRARTYLAGTRDAVAVDSGPVVQANTVVGRLLGEELLPAPVAAALGEAVAGAHAQGAALRLGVQATGEVARLPWETLWLPAAAQPLCLDSVVCLYRKVPATVAAPTGGPLRILVAISSPLSGGSGLLDYERELRNVLKAVRGARAHEAEVRIVQFATTDAIRTALTQWPAHVLHMSGHGGLGVIELEDAVGEARVLDVQTFVKEAIPAGRMPPVVALAACYTDAAATSGAGSFAAGLLAEGASVVIASQTAITDVYATRVFATVYGHLASDPGADVIAAVAEARRSVQRELEQAATDGRDRLAGLGEWAVLSVLSSTGRYPVVDPTAAMPAAGPAPAARGVLRRQPGEVVGRRLEQRRLPSQLLSRSVAGLVLHGIGGVGKTTLADELIARIIELDPTVTVAVMTGQLGAEQVLNNIQNALGDVLYQPPRPVWATPAVLRALSRAGDGDLPWLQRLAILCDQVLPVVPVLVVLDNFEDNLRPATTGGPRTVADDSLARLLGGLVVAAGAARLLVTSRYRFTLPDQVEHALAFHQLGPLSYAETLKLAWALPQLDRLDDEQLEQVWRVVGGHPRCLEYLDALLAGGVARFADVRRRLVKGATARLRALGRPGTDIEDYLTGHDRLDSAMAETVALAADDILLDDLLAVLACTSGAYRLLLGASVYRRPVDHNALAYQVGRHDPTAANTTALEAARRAIQDILAAVGLPSGPVDWQRLPDVVRTSLKPHLDLRPTPPVRVDVDLPHLVGACSATSLLTSTTPGGVPAVFVHRWTATELHRREVVAGNTVALTEAHRHAADYWRWRVDRWPQPPEGDVDDLREVHYHYQQAVALGDGSARADLANVAWDLEVRLGKLGRRAEALTYCQQAVDLKRDLAGEDKATHIRDLAGLLNNLGIRLSNLGRREEALQATVEAVEVYRRLAAANPAAFVDDQRLAPGEVSSVSSGLAEEGG